MSDLGNDMAAARAGKKGFLEGLQPSKPPARYIVPIIDDPARTVVRAKDHLRIAVPSGTLRGGVGRMRGALTDRSARGLWNDLSTW